MNNDTTLTPADVRERVAFEAFAWEHGRRGAAAEWIRAQWQGETPKRRAMYFDLADRILALLRTPRGEGEGDTLWRDFEAALVEFEAAAIALGRREALPLGPREAAIDRVVQARRRVIDCACALAALRSEAQGDEADALDLIRWAETQGAALEPVVGNIMPPGTYACYVEGVGDDPAEYEDAGEPYMGPGILGAIRAARRGEGGGK